jgi:hypothetical protein
MATSKRTNYLILSEVVSWCGKQGIDIREFKKLMDSLKKVPGNKSFRDSIESLAEAMQYII